MTLIGINNAQQNNIYYDSSSGNYIIEYIGHFIYIRGTDGTLRLCEGEKLQEGEEFVYRDSLVKVIFEPSTKIDPFVSSNITEIVNPNCYKYDYTITNGTSSIQRLQEFDLKILSSITNVNSPDEFWKSNHYSFVPVFGWYNSKGKLGIDHPLNGIAPDSSRNGFSFISSGLPAITNAYFAGKVTIYLTFPDEPPDKITELLKPLRKFPNNTVERKTIGPVDPPDPFSAAGFTDSLIHYCVMSDSLKWITDYTATTKYTGYFENTKSHIQQNNNSAAINVLDSVLTDVEADSGVTLTSEAYALIKYNTEYLKNQLSQSKGIPHDVRPRNSQEN